MTLPAHLQALVASAAEVLADAGTPGDEAQDRLDAVEEALGWIGTPYHHAARLKGVAVDCGMFLAEVFERAEVLPHIEPDPYPHDWHLHHADEQYLGLVEKFGRRVPVEGEPLPGDVLLFKYGRCLSHGAIVVAWPVFVHSYIGVGVVLDSIETNLDMSERLAGVWSFWGVD